MRSVTLPQVSPIMDELLDVLQGEIDETIASIDREIESARKRAARERSRRGISKWCLEVALLLYVMMSYKWDAAVLWLKSKRRRGQQISPHMSDADITAYLDNAFLQADEDALMSYVTPDNSSLSTSAIRTASLYMIEFKLAEEIWLANIAHGKVMRTTTLCERADCLLDANPGAQHIPRKTPYFSDSTKQWAKRFRKKFHISYGHIRNVGREIGVDELQRKAAVTSC